MSEDDLNIILAITLSFFAFLVILVTVILFIYHARKKMFAKEIEIINLKLQTKKNHVNAMIEVQDTERARIARNIHDDIGSNLVEIHHNLKKLKNNSTDQPTLDICDTSIKTSLSLIENVRNIAHRLMPTELEDVGLLESLNQLCKKFNQEGSLKIVLLHDLSKKQLALIQSEYQVHIYRIVQELIANSIKHAKATQIDLKLVDIESKIVELNYKDNGIGTDLAIEEMEEGLGIQNILSRTAIIGGKASFSSSPQNGFSFTLVLPLK